MSQWVWIGGAIAVESVLQANSREVRLIYSTLERFDSRMARINRLARERFVPINAQREDTLTALLQWSGHGGIAAEVGPRELSPLGDLVAGPAPALFMLDGIEDPFNFGQAVRALYAAGIDGLVVRSRNWLMSGAAVRASAGATELLPIAEALSADEAATAARARGLRVAVADEDGAPMSETDLTGPLLLVIGGEKRGITRSFRRAADLRVRIPYGRPFAYALGSAAAATLLAFEVLRQRGAGRATDAAP